MQFYELLLAAELSISLSRYVNLLAGNGKLDNLITSFNTCFFFNFFSDFIYFLFKKIIEVALFSCNLLAETEVSRAFSHDVKATMLVFQNSPVGLS